MFVSNIISVLDDELLASQSPYLSVQKANQVVNREGLNPHNTQNLIGKMIKDGFIPHAYKVSTQWRIPLSHEVLEVEDASKKEFITPAIERKLTKREKEEQMAKKIRKYGFFIFALICIIGYCNHDDSSSQKERGNEYTANNDLQQAVNDLVTIYSRDNNSMKEVTDEEAQRAFTLRIQQIQSIYSDLTASRIADKVVYSWQRTKNESLYNGSLLSYVNNLTGAIRANHRDNVTMPFDETIVIYSTLLIEANQ